MPLPADVWKRIKDAPLPKVRARVQPKPGEMNGLEKAYAQYLNVLLAGGEILWWKYEGMNLRLAPRTYLRIDFNVVLADGTLEMHECKGFMEEDALAKLKVAAAMFPFRFVIVRAANRQKTQWTHTEV